MITAGNLVASLSSEREEIEDNRYGTLYLLGENGETKYFYLNSADYRVEIVPYDEGTMDVTITQTESDGSASSVYYADVQLNTDMVISTGTQVSADSALTVAQNAETSTIPPETEIPVTSLRIEGPQEVAVGGSVQLSAMTGPDTATGRTVTWSSSDPTVLEVSSDGVVSGLAEGSGIITATAGNGVSAQVTFSAYVPAESLSSNVETISLLVGESCLLPVTVAGNATHTIVWSSSDASVASVDSSGTVNALSVGAAIVTAEIDGLTHNFYVTVSSEPLTVTLYQSDTQGMRLKADLANVSCEQSFAGAVYLALYEDSRMMDVRCVSSGLAPGETVTCYYPMNMLDPARTYTASAFILDSSWAPLQVETAVTILS